MKLNHQAFSSLCMVLGAIIAIPSTAGETSDSKPKLSGYAIAQYQASTKQDDETNSFDVRMVRIALAGHFAGEFEYKVQAHLNGNTATLGSSPRIVDAYAEWQRHAFLKVKAGQFKRPFSFENPMHPIDQGFMGYSQNISKLAGFNDRVGEHASNGRDIGVQLQGDFLKNAKGRNLLHYQIGVFNGQGINTKDVDNRKDVIGGIWVMPIKGMRIGAFGWTGSYARKGTWSDDEHGNQVTVEEKEGETEYATYSGVRRLSQNRYAFSFEYKADDWTFRSEYIHSTGYAFKTTYQTKADLNDCAINSSLGNKADGLYALCIAPIIKGRLAAKARYDLYRSSADWTTSRTQYEFGLNYTVVKNIELHAEYALINDRALSHPNYSIADLQLSVRF